MIVFGHYWGGGEASVTIDGKVSGESKNYSTTFDFPEITKLHPEIERIWAFAKIEGLQNRLDYYGEDADIKSAIIDVAVENGLVTDYTSMIVLREEWFEQLGITRLNKERVEEEQLARRQRTGQGVRNNRVDTSRPMYSNVRTSHSNSNGGGAFGPWMLLLLFPLLMQHLGRRKWTQ